MQTIETSTKPTADLSLDSAVLTKMRCAKCQGTLAKNPETLACQECRSEFPLVAGRFPDFLTDAERIALDEELKFWAAHFQAVEYQDESEASYQTWIELMHCTGSDEILELGCGSGAMLRRMPAKTRVGLEPAANLLEPSHGFTGVIGSAHALPFRDESFDLVFFKHALHHIQDKRKALEEAARVLRPGGRLVVIEPNADHPQRRLISNPRSLLRRTGIFSRFIGPVETFQSLSELSSWAEELGLTAGRTLFRESDYDRLTLRQGLQRAYSRLLRPLLPQKLLLPNYFASFSKPSVGIYT